MNRTSTFAILAITALLLATGQSQATSWTSNVFLDGLQEVGPNASPGYGSATVTFDDVTGGMNVTGSFSSLIANVAAAHVHGYVGPGVNAGVIIPLTPVGGTSGTFSGAGIIPAIRIPDVLNGLTYINVHTSAFPGGEIRGQITDFRVPEPSAIALALAALIGVVVFRRRKS